MREFKSALSGYDEELLQEGLKMLRERLDEIDYTDEGVLFSESLSQEDVDLMAWAFELDLTLEAEYDDWYNNDLTEQERKEYLMWLDIMHKCESGDFDYPVAVLDSGGQKILLDSKHDILPPGLAFPCEVYEINEVPRSDVADFYFFGITQYPDNPKTVKLLKTPENDTRNEKNPIFIGGELIGEYE